MSDIKFKKGELCHADGKNWLIWEESKGTVICDKNHTIKSMASLVSYKDFQLNCITIGDFITASELDTEQKYNDVVEVFGLFGFEPCKHHSKYIGMVNYWKGVEIYHGEVANTNSTDGRKLTYHQIIAIGKLKRMMLEREKSAPKTNPDLIADFAKASSNKYEREITDRQGNSATVDVYDVIIAYGVTCPATQHAIKKLLCTGDRGHKDTLTDLSEARDAITRAIELN